MRGLILPEACDRANMVDTREPEAQARTKMPRQPGED